VLKTLKQILANPKINSVKLRATLPLQSLRSSKAKQQPMPQKQHTAPVVGRIGRATPSARQTAPKRLAKLERVSPIDDTPTEVDFIPIEQPTL
jgi:hypothetical protein